MRNIFVRIAIGTAFAISTTVVGLAPAAAAPTPSKPTPPPKPPKPPKPTPPTDPTPEEVYIQCIADGNSVQVCLANSGG